MLKVSEIFEFTSENSWINSDRTLIGIVRLVRSLADRTFQLRYAQVSIFMRKQRRFSYSRSGPSLSEQMSLPRSQSVLLVKKWYGAYVFSFLSFSTKKLLANFRQTLIGPFSTVSRPIYSSKNSSIRLRDLQYLHTCALSESFGIQ